MPREALGRKQPATSAIQRWSDEYALLLPTYGQFAKKLQELLAELLDMEEIDYHGIECRAKSIESFREKIQRPGKNYTDPLREVPDLAALRVIAYYPDDTRRIRKLLDEEFVVDPTQSADKAEELGPDQFGYISVHVVISLSEQRALITEWSRFRDLHAEIQIRTVLQHAWASISHKLQYKHEADVPRPLRRKLLRLSGLLELADEQFSELRRERADLNTQVSESIGADNLSLTIDRDSLMTYLQHAEATKKVDAAVRKFGFKTLSPDHESTGLSQLVTVCQQVGINTLANLDHTLREVEVKMSGFFEAFAEKRSRAHGEMAHWVALLLVGVDHGQRLTPGSIPWSQAYTEDAFAAGERVFIGESKQAKE